MIVKNESKIITRLLESVVEIIDSYCICDTGSTDGTEEIISQYFKKKGIEGKIINEPFQNFGYNRSFALKACNGLSNADYILLLDADMKIQINPQLTPEKLKRGLVSDLYYIFQGNECLSYKNIRIVKNNLDIYYWGVTHEYVKTPDHTNYTMAAIDSNHIFIYDLGDGGSKTNKYTRDIELLKQGLTVLPNNDRYLFYLANSYRDTGQLDLAIETYKRRISVGGWIDEIWNSHNSIGRCAKALQNMEMAVHHWLEAYNVLPERLENIYELIYYYRNAMKYNIAYQFYVIADNERRKHKGGLDYLFLEKDVYDWKLDYEFTVIAFYRNTANYNIRNICMKVLSYPLLTDGFAANILSNYKFYSNKLMDFSLPYTLNDQWNTLRKCSLVISPEFVSSTPSFCMDAGGDLISLIRYVNYRILENGSYQNQKHIETINVISTIDIKTHPRGKWIKKKETILKYDTQWDGLYVGLEDVRLFSFNDKIFYNANRGLKEGEQIMVEHGSIKSGATTEDSVLLHLAGQRDVEKNWVMFESGTKELKMVYGWHPLTIGVNLDACFIKTQELPSPLFFKYLRGSTNGITIGDEIWFICHTVSFENRRYYYHIFVVLDAGSLSIKKYSPFFTFEGATVEYCLGLMYLSNTDELMVGYSLLDRETKYNNIPKRSMDDWMIR
jgi:tetratricopeptide (TPR) repeat protein